MTRSPLSAIVPLLALVAAPLWAEDAAVPSPEAATWHDHVAPIVAKSCVGCHGGERPKGRFRAETLEEFLAGGREGATVVAGKPEESLVYALLVGEKKPYMPPKKAEPLSEGEILTFRAWILGGAKAGEPKAGSQPYSRPLEPIEYRRPPVVAALAFTPDGRRLLVGGYREVLVHEVAALVAAGIAADGGATPQVEPVARLVGEAERVHGLALLGDGSRLAVAAGSPGRFGEAQLWSLDDGKLLAWKRIGKDVLYSVAATADASRILVAGTTRALHTLDGATLEEIGSVEIHSDWVLGAAFVHGDQRIVSGGRDKSAKASEAADGRLLKTLASFDGPVTRVLARPGGDLALVASETGEARLWSAEKLEEARKLENQPGAVLAAGFSGDGKRLALAGSHAEARVYEVDSGRRLATVSGGPDWTFAVALDAGGERVALGGYEGILRIYEVKDSRKIAEVMPVGLVDREGASLR